MPASSMGGMQPITPYGHLEKMEFEMGEQMKLQPDGSFVYAVNNLITSKILTHSLLNTRLLCFSFMLHSF